MKEFRKQIAEIFDPQSSKFDVSDSLSRFAILTNFLSKMFCVGFIPLNIVFILKGEATAFFLIVSLQSICLFSVYLNSIRFYLASRLNLLLTLSVCLLYTSDAADE